MNPFVVIVHFGWTSLHLNGDIDVLPQEVAEAAVLTHVTKRVSFQRVFALGIAGEFDLKVEQSRFFRLRLLRLFHRDQSTTGLPAFGWVNP